MFITYIGRHRHAAVDAANQRTTEGTQLKVLMIMAYDDKHPSSNIWGVPLCANGSMIRDKV